jgi:DNA-directed RNA polymerase specialized sigma24 family protein
MTMASGLLDPHLLRSLTTCLKRRVPSSDVEDVAQTVLCDALEASGAPSDPEELRKWVAGIARHKVADYHRRARRLVLDDVACDAPAPPPSMRLEARGLLANVAEATKTDRDREALGWLVREHAGERLCEIASEAGLTGAAVRQRVSRLRRALRARFGAALTIVVAIGAGSALYAGSRSQHDPIVAEPSANATREALAVRGSWRVVAVTVEGPLTEVEKRLLEAELANAIVEVATDRVELVTTSGRVERRELRAGKSFVLPAPKATDAAIQATAARIGDAKDGRLLVTAAAGRAHVRLVLGRR